MFTVENACAAGSSAFNLATLALRAGSCDIALWVSAEKMNIPDKAKMFSAFDGGWDVSTVEQNKATLLAMGDGIVPPPGSVSERPYSVFMDVYAAICNPTTCCVMARHSGRSPRWRPRIISTR